MQTSFTGTHIRRFGPFEVNLATGELRKRGFRIALQEQPRRVLAALLEANGATVSRAELCRRLWPEGTFVDFEHSLNAAVRRLRTALGDDADTPRFVETVPGRGYRFSVSRGDMRLAVLPFAVLAAEDGADGTAAGIFVDGLADEMTTQLARACPDGVGVIARTAVMRLASEEQNAGSVGRLLGARHVVEGAVRRDGTRIRITVQLTEAEDQTLVWAASYDRSLEDALTVQTELAEAVSVEIARLLGTRRSADEFSHREGRRKRLASVGTGREVQLRSRLQPGERRLEKIVG